MAVAFDGSAANYYVSTTPAPPLPHTAQWTIGCWANFRSSSTTTKGLYLYGLQKTANVGSYGDFGFYLNGNTGYTPDRKVLDFYGLPSPGSKASFSSSNKYGADQTWRLILIECDGASTLHMYTVIVDGTRVHEGSHSLPYDLTTGTGAHNGHLWLGGSDMGSGQADAYLAHFFIAPGNLTAAQMAQMGAGATIAEVGYAPWLWYKLGNADDTTDYGTEGNDLIVTGAPTSVDGPSVLQATPTPVALTGAAVAVTTATATLHRALALAATASAQSTAAGDLQLAIPLDGAALAAAAAQATLASQADLSASAQAAAAAQATLTPGAGLAGRAHSAAAGAATLTLRVALDGAALAQATARGALANAGALRAAATAQATATGTLVQAIPIRSAALVATQAGGRLAQRINLAGAGAVISQAQGALQVTTTLAGAALTQAAAQGDLTLHLSLEAAAAAQLRARLALRVAGNTLRPNPAWRVQAPPRSWRAALAPRRLVAHA